MTLRVGSLVFSTDQGLGILARDFVKHGVVTAPLVIAHGRRPDNFNWYPGAEIVGNVRRDLKQMEEFCESCDVVLFFETPFRYELIDFCRKVGVKTALMVMHECALETLPAMPDVFLCPSELDYAVFRAKYPKADVRFIPVPVDVPWRLRTRAEVFVHSGGWGGLKGRNGARELIDAWQYVRSPTVLKLRSQCAIDPKLTAHPRKENCGGPIYAEVGTVPHAELWRDGGDGDVFVFPEKFNGLSLPLQEARAAGMLVMCGDRFPMNTWLPKEPLIPVASYRRARVGPPYNEFDEAVFDPRTIAATIDAWFGRDISEYSHGGRAWAEENSWEKLKSRYMEALTP